MSLKSAGIPREIVKIVALIGAGVAAFGTNQSIGVTMPVHLISDIGGSAADVGLVAAAGTLGVILGRVMSAGLVDRLGPAVLGAVSMMLIVIACLAYLFVPDRIAGLVLVRTMHGIGFAGATTALLVAMVTMVTLSSRQRSIALANLAMPVAGAIFPVVAIEVFDASLINVAAGSAAMGVAGGVGYLFLARTAPPIRPTQRPRASTSMPNMRRLPALLLVTAGFLGAADAAAMDYLPVLGTARNIDGYGWNYTILALGSAATLTFITAMRRAFASTSLVVVGGVMTAGALATLPGVGTLSPLLIMMGAYGIGFAVAQTGVNTLAAEWSPVEVGKSLAGVLLAFDLGRVVGVYLIGLLIDYFNFIAALVPLAVLLAMVSVASGCLLRRRSSQ